MELIDLIVKTLLIAMMIASVVLCRLVLGWSFVSAFAVGAPTGLLFGFLCIYLLGRGSMSKK